MLNRSWVTMVELLECWSLHPWQILVQRGPVTWCKIQIQYISIATISATWPNLPWKLSHKSSALLPWRAPSRDQSALEFATFTTPHAWKSFQYTCVVALSIIYVHICTSDMCVYLCICLRPKNSWENTKLVGIQIWQALPICEYGRDLPGTTN